MNSFFGIRPIVACTAGAVGLAGFLFFSLTIPQAVFAGLAYIVLRGAVGKEW